MGFNILKVTEPLRRYSLLFTTNQCPNNIYLFKVNSRNSRKMYEICLKLKFVSAIYSYFTKSKHFKNHEKCFYFIQKVLFVVEILIFKISLLSFDIFQIQRVRWNWNNYDVAKWFAWIAKCNSWNNSKTAWY